MFQFPGGSDNYLTISGSSHPFLSSSEVGLYVGIFWGIVLHLGTRVLSLNQGDAFMSNRVIGFKSFGPVKSPKYVKKSAF